jgi:hypothetical protein
MSDRRLPSPKIMPRLVRRYLELSDLCYRVSVTRHDHRGRFQKGHRGRSPHPVLLKKVDLDRCLVQLYERFFGSSPEPNDTSTSNSRRQGSEMPTQGDSSSPATSE